MSAGVLAFLPAATLTRAVPTARLASSPSGSTVHLLADDGRPACGRRPRGLAEHDLEASEPPALRVCTSCARTLPDVTRMHLTALGRPSVSELAAVREAEVLRASTALRDLLEHHRTEAVLEGSVSERVVFDGNPPSAHDYNGFRGSEVPLTLGLMIGSLIPGAMTGGRLWLPGTASSPARTTNPGGAASDVVLSPHGPAHQRPGGGRRYGPRPVAR